LPRRNLRGDGPPFSLLSPRVSPISSRKYEFLQEEKSDLSKRAEPLLPLTWVFFSQISKDLDASRIEEDIAFFFCAPSATITLLPLTPQKGSSLRRKSTHRPPRRALFFLFAVVAHDGQWPSSSPPPPVHIPFSSAEIGKSLDTSFFLPEKERDAHRSPLSRGPRRSPFPP